MYSIILKIFRYLFYKPLRNISIYNERFVPYICILRGIVRSYCFEEYGEKVSIGKKTHIQSSLNIKVGNRVAIRDYVIIVGKGKMEINDGAVINNNNVIGCYEKIIIGKNVMIGAYSYILDVDHSFEGTKPIYQQELKSAPIIIEDDVWISSYCFITKGVTIGKGSVVGANSVVTKDIPPYSIAVGSPARVIKNRND